MMTGGMREGMSVMRMGPHETTSTPSFIYFYLFIFTAILFRWDLSHEKFRLQSLGKASYDSHVTQPTVHAWCFNISIIHQTLTWTTGS